MAFAAWWSSPPRGLAEDVLEVLRSELQDLRVLHRGARGRARFRVPVCVSSRSADRKFEWARVFWV